MIFKAINLLLGIISMLIIDGNLNYEAELEQFDIDMADNMIMDRLEGVKMRFDEVGQLLTDPDVMSDVKRFVKL